MAVIDGAEADDNPQSAEAFVTWRKPTITVLTKQ
jgi:hypothetical protein